MTTCSSVSRRLAFGVDDDHVGGDLRQSLGQEGVGGQHGDDVVAAFQQADAQAARALDLPALWASARSWSGASGATMTMRSAGTGGMPGSCNIRAKARGARRAPGGRQAWRVGVSAAACGAASHPAARARQAGDAHCVTLDDQAALGQQINELHHFVPGQAAARAELRKRDVALRHVAEHAAICHALMHRVEIGPGGESILFHESNDRKVTRQYFVAAMIQSVVVWPRGGKSAPWPFGVFLTLFW